MGDRYYDIMQRTLELAETGLEALEQIKLYLTETKYEQAVILLQDTINAFYSIEKAIQPIMPNLLPNELDQLAQKLTESYQLIIFACEQSEYIRAQEVLQFDLLPSYKKWHTELDRSLLPYITLQSGGKVYLPTQTC